MKGIDGVVTFSASFAGVGGSLREILTGLILSRGELEDRGTELSVW